MDKQIYAILNDVADAFSSSQLQYLEGVLRKYIVDNPVDDEIMLKDSTDYIALFLEAKRIEGCSEKTLHVYERAIKKLSETSDKPLTKITTEDIRLYLGAYQLINNCSKVTMDNERRYISTFFAWLEEEDYIIKSPCKRIHKIRASITVKEVLSDEDIEYLRDNCILERDRAMIDFLYSTGIRVGELVELDISDINFDERECIVHGKGDKERQVYFDAKTKIHLKKYLQTRTIDKGMPVEQLQKLLGHEQIDTTMRYAMVSQTNVKASHKKYRSFLVISCFHIEHQ